jgi:hypothetical protein
MLVLPPAVGSILWPLSKGSIRWPKRPMDGSSRIAKIASLSLIGFLGQDAEVRSTPNGNHYTRFALASSVICWNKLADWAGSFKKCAYGRSKANSGTGNTLPRSPIAACAWPRSMRPQFWHSTALRVTQALWMLNHIQVTNRSNDRICGAWLKPCPALFSVV